MTRVAAYSEDIEDAALILVRGTALNNITEEVCDWGS